MTRTRSQHAFTLLELVLVMVVIVTALAMVAPSLSGWGRGSKLRDMSDQFLAVTRWARAQAIADAKIYRLNIDAEAGKFWLTVQEGEQFIALGNSFGQVYALPEGYGITATLKGDAIDFLPSGRVTPAHVRITTDLGAVTEIAAELPTEQFTVVTAAEVQR